MRVINLILFENLDANTSCKKHVRKENQYSYEMHRWLKQMKERIVQFLFYEHCIKYYNNYEHETSGQK